MGTVTTSSATVSSNNVTTSGYTTTSTACISGISSCISGDYLRYTNATTTTGSSNFGSWTIQSPNIYPLNDYSNWGTSQVGNLQDYINDLMKDMLEKEDNKKMANYNFGAYTNSNLRLSLYGLAVKNSCGKWVSYDRKTHQLIDAEVFNFEIDTSKIFYKIPKATDSVETGDILLYKDRPVFVENVRNDGKFEVIDPYEGTAVTILPLTSPFGFNYTTVIVSITDYLPKANEDNPFGSLLPFIMGGDNSALMAMMMSDGEIDPMMMMMLGNKDGNMLPFIMMKMCHKKKEPKKRTKYYHRENDDLLDHHRAMYGGMVEDEDE